MLSNVYAFEEGVYDCSNMLADQAMICDNLGIEYDVAYSKLGVHNDKCSHVWLILELWDHDIHWECTSIRINPFP